MKRIWLLVDDSAQNFETTTKNRTDSDTAVSTADTNFIVGRTVQLPTDDEAGIPESLVSWNPGIKIHVCTLVQSFRVQYAPTSKYCRSMILLINCWT
jgi:hypothetical protein